MASLSSLQWTFEVGEVGGRQEKACYSGVCDIEVLLCSTVPVCTCSTGMYTTTPKKNPQRLKGKWSRMHVGHTKDFFYRRPNARMKNSGKLSGGRKRERECLRDDSLWCVCVCVPNHG